MPILYTLQLTYNTHWHHKGNCVTDEETVMWDRWYGSQVTIYTTKVTITNQDADR